MDTNHPLSPPEAAVPPDAVTAVKASVGVTAFTRKIDATITCGGVPSVMCRTATVRPTVKYPSARDAASLSVSCVPASNAQSRNCAGVFIRIKIRGRRLRRIEGAELPRNLTLHPVRALRTSDRCHSSVKVAARNVMGCQPRESFGTMRTSRRDHE